jgi:hypothetical protein
MTSFRESKQIKNESEEKRHLRLEDLRQRGSNEMIKQKIKELLHKHYSLNSIKLTDA